MGKRENLYKLLENNENKDVITPLIDEIVYMEKQLDELKRFPFYERHPRYPQKIRRTEAAKLYKEIMQSYKDAVRILLSALSKAESTAADELLNRLKEFA